MEYNGWKNELKEDRGALQSYRKKDYSTFFFNFTGDRFIGIHLEWQGQLYFFINVYSAGDIRSRRKLWDDLCDVKNKF